MAIVMVHYFPEEDFYKISYTGKDNIDAFERQQKQWVGHEYKLSWSKEISNVETAKLLKKTYAKELRKYQSSFIKSALDTFKTDNLPEPIEVDEVADREIHVHLIKFTYGDKSLFKVGYSSTKALVKYAGLPGLGVFWEHGPTLEAPAKEFTTFVYNKYDKVIVEGLNFSRALVCVGDYTYKTLKAEWLAFMLGEPVLAYALA